MKPIVVIESPEMTEDDMKNMIDEVRAEIGKSLRPGPGTRRPTRLLLFVLTKCSTTN